MWPSERAAVALPYRGRGSDGCDLNAYTEGTYDKVATFEALKKPEFFGKETNRVFRLNFTRGVLSWFDTPSSHCVGRVKVDNVEHIYAKIKDSLQSPQWVSIPFTSLPAGGKSGTILLKPLSVMDQLNFTQFRR